MGFDEIERALAGAPAAAGYLAVETDRGRRELLLGPRTQLEGAVPMLDWRTAPLAEPFFRHGPGEAYELATGAEGRVLERWLLAGRGGLEALIGDDRTVTRGGERPVVRPAPAPAREVDRSQLVVLDPEQQAAVDLPADTSLVLDGEAGVGKTLVALYRVAALARRADAKSRRFRALVLVPTEGLRRLVRVLADRLGIGKLEIALVDDWLYERALRAFPGLPKRRSEGATAQVIALKRHPGAARRARRLRRLGAAARRRARRQAAPLADAALPPVRRPRPARARRRGVGRGAARARDRRRHAAHAPSSRPPPSGRTATSTPTAWSRSTTARSTPARPPRTPAPPTPRTRRSCSS